MITLLEIETELKRIIQHLSYDKPSRELSLVKTKLEEALHWLYAEIEARKE